MNVKENFLPKKQHLFLFTVNTHCVATIGLCTWCDNKVRELILAGLFIMNLYQLDSQSSLLFGSTKKAA